MVGLKGEGFGWGRSALVMALLGCGMGMEARGAVTWAVDAGGVWTDAGNWSSNPNLPGSGDDVVINRVGGEFLVTLSSGVQTVNSAVIDEQLAISNEARLSTTSATVNDLVSLSNGTMRGTTVGGSGEIVFDGGPGMISPVSLPPTITGILLSGADALVSTIGANTLTINSGLTVKTGTGSGWIAAGTVVNNGVISSETAGQSLSIVGTTSIVNTGTIQSLNGGGLALYGNMTLSGSGHLLAAGGALTLGHASIIYVANAGNTAGTISGDNTAVEVDAGGELTSDGIRTFSWFVNGLSTVRANGTATGVSKVNTLLIGGSTGAWTGELKLNDNKIIVESSGSHASTLSTTRDQVAFGKTHAAGIVVTPAAAGQVVVVSDNAVADSSTPVMTSFFGQSVDAGSVLVMSTYPGDATMDGVVDISDLTAVANHWQDGVTNGGGSGESFGEAVTGLGLFGGTSAVPEPGTLMVLGIGALGMVRRRRG